MTRLEALRAAHSLSDLATLLGFKPKALAYILYIKPPTAKYSSFTIPKKTGGTREIRAPAADLMNLQTRLSDLLQDCEQEIRAHLNLKRTISHGFVRHKSIMTNASQHLHKRFVFNIDIENFFGTINFGRVRGFFIKNRNFSLTPEIATVLAQIICHENQLPQGAPTSPVASNLIAHILDIRMVKLASEVGCVYSRYADDLTFSTNKRNFPSAIALCAEADHNWSVGQELRNIVHATGFRLNDKKTRIHYADSRQEVTGLVVNRKVNVKSEYRNHVRQMVNRLCNTGKFDLVPASKVKNEEDKLEGTLGQLSGMLSFIYSVRLFDRKRHKTEGKTIPSDRTFIETYKKFLIYKDFYAAERPVILLEGKTDNIYLRCAIRKLADDLPHLANKDAKGKIELLARLFNNTKLTGEILGLSGGSGTLKTFISTYRNTSQHFKSDKSPAPIIIVIDNDAGATHIFSVISGILKIKVTGDEPFYKIYGHIYIVPTPKNNGKETYVEMLFTEDTLATKLKGKAFDHTEKKDGNKYYGKFDFARYVIKMNEKNIDFSGFHPILKTIDSIISGHG